MVNYVHGLIAAVRTLALLAILVWLCAPPDDKKRFIWIFTGIVALIYGFLVAFVGAEKSGNFLA
jgi:hypothetical protein